MSRPDARIDIRDIDDKTPLSWAIENRQAAVVKVLLDRLGIDHGEGDRHCAFEIIDLGRTVMALRLKI